MRNEDTDRSGAGWSATPAGRLTPADVQQKQFRTARMGGGYRMREVDEFLDQVTDTLSSLIAENERLRRGQPSPSSAPARPAVPSGAVDRSAIEAFLRSEKGFLQSLGSLVQDHAEELKGMVRAARGPDAAPTASVGAAASAAVPVEPAPSERASVVADEPAAPVASTSEPEEVQAPSTSEPEEMQVASTSEPEEMQVASTSEPDETQDEEPAEDSGPDRDTTPAAETEEPIRLDEPEPARSRRTEEGPTGSLRELFWGEE